jgi:UDP-glucose 4-epimerase
MKILITGGAGYVGTELVRLLSREPGISEIVVYDNLSRRNHDLFLGAHLGAVPVRFVAGDILDTRRLGKALHRVDVVYHLAARVTTPFADGDVHGLEQVNHWGTAELSYLLEQRGVGRLIYLSSTAVYGVSDSPLGLDSPPAPVTAYGVSKLRGERMLERLAEDLDLYTIRCGNVYGYSPSMRFDAVINRFIFEAHFNGRITIEGSGEQRRAFVHVQQAARALAGLREGGPRPGMMHLVERNLSINEIVAAVREVYPGLETISVAQDLPRRSLVVEPDPRLQPWGLELPSLREQLEQFRARFAFGHAGP